ncbi:hypothetical protein GCM10026987_25900 [Belliella aquatica]|uniref:Transposase DDE domain-containing protein n=1 Tax=Belliella aquatica TaxID=1323734 RepID=A0ABQ1N630_9BACT|nr:hypothetical protein GCM10010993_36130 [Belliella aquatica]
MRLGVHIRIIGKLVISALIDLNISFCLATCKKVGKPIRQSYRYKKKRLEAAFRFYLRSISLKQFKY